MGFDKAAGLGISLAQLEYSRLFSQAWSQQNFLINFCHFSSLILFAVRPKNTILCIKGYMAVLLFQQNMHWSPYSRTTLDINRTFRSSLFTFPLDANRSFSRSLSKTQMVLSWPNCHFGTFAPMHRFQKLFLPNAFFLSIKKKSVSTFSQNVYLGLSRPVHVPI